MSGIIVDFSGTPKVLEGTDISKHLKNHQIRCKQIFLQKLNQMNMNLLCQIFQCRSKDIILQSPVLQLVLKSLDIQFASFETLHENLST